jgi:hypothetical protein
MNIVVRWKRDHIPHSVFENVKTFLEADSLIEGAIAKYGSPHSINVFEGYKLVASLRTIR